MLFNVYVKKFYQVILYGKHCIYGSLISLLCCLSFANAHNINFDNIFNSVVKIYTANITSKHERDKFFRLKNLPKDLDNAIASGTIFDAYHGYIITNSHVVEGKNSIKIELYNGFIFQAEVIVQDKGIDLAILKLHNPNQIKLSAIKIPSFKSLKLGEEVFAIGNPCNIGISITKGIISAIRSTQDGFNVDLGDLIQTDFVLNPGNSGGPLLDSKGELIGINSAILSAKGVLTTGISFAIPANVVYLFIHKSLKGDKLRKYWLGFTAVERNEISQHLNQLQIAKGLKITHIYDNSPASKIGLQAGDILLSLDHQAINTVSNMNFSIVSLESNDPIPIVINRNNKIITLAIIPELVVSNIDLTLITSGLLHDIKVVESNPLTAYEANLPYLTKGVIIYEILDNSYAKKLGLQTKDLIISINNQSITSVADMLDILSNDEKLDNIVFMREDTKIEINIK